MFKSSTLTGWIRNSIIRHKGIARIMQTVANLARFFLFLLNKKSPKREIITFPNRYPIPTIPAKTVAVWSLISEGSSAK